MNEWISASLWYIGADPCPLLFEVPEPFLISRRYLMGNFEQNPNTTRWHRHPPCPQPLSLASCGIFYAHAFMHILTAHICMHIHTHMHAHSHAHTGPQLPVLPNSSQAFGKCPLSFTPRSGVWSEGECGQGARFDQIICSKCGKVPAAPLPGAFSKPPAANSFPGGSAAWDKPSLCQAIRTQWTPRWTHFSPRLGRLLEGDKALLLPFCFVLDCILERYVRNVMLISNSSLLSLMPPNTSIDTDICTPNHRQTHMYRHTHTCWGIHSVHHCLCAHGVWSGFLNTATKASESCLQPGQDLSLPTRE